MHKMFRFVQLILFVASEDRSDLFLSFCRDLYDVLLILGAFFFFTVLLYMLYSFLLEMLIFVILLDLMCITKLQIHESKSKILYFKKLVSSYVL
jgi:hypothetical protein